MKAFNCLGYVLKYSGTAPQGEGKFSLKNKFDKSKTAIGYFN